MILMMWYPLVCWTHFPIFNDLWIQRDLWIGKPLMKRDIHQILSSSETFGGSVVPPELVEQSIISPGLRCSSCHEGITTPFSSQLTHPMLFRYHIGWHTRCIDYYMSLLPGAVPKWACMVIFSVMILTLEFLGGMNSVVLTDARFGINEVVIRMAVQILPTLIRSGWNMNDRPCIISLHICVYVCRPLICHSA